MHTAAIDGDGPQAVVRQVLGEICGRVGRHWFIFFLMIAFPFLAIWGAIGVTFGLPLHFRDDLTIFELAQSGQTFKAIVNSPSFYTHAFTTFFAGLFWLLAAVMGDREDRAFGRLTAAQEARYLFIRILAVSAAMLYAACFPISRVVPAVGFSPSGFGEIARCVIGFLTGLGVFSFLALLSRSIVRGMRVLAKGIPNPRAYVLLVALVALIFSLHFFPKILTVVALFKIAAGVTAFYVLINVFPERWRAWAFLAFVALPIIIGSFGAYKYTFPGLEKLYDCPIELEKDQLAGPAQRPANNPLRNCRGQSEKRLTPIMALDRFAARQQQSLKDRRLIVVAASGGAYRATFWTALVLDELRRETRSENAADLPRYVRLLTGASGGMIGSSYFASLTPNELQDVEQFSLVKLIAQDISRQNNAERSNFLSRLNEPLPRDSLSDVSQQLAFWDIMDIFFPGPLKRWIYERFGVGDRGRTLEMSWKRIGHDGSQTFTFQRLADATQRGEAPSIIFSPMIVETGQPLLISDLDLAGISDPEERHSWEFFSMFPAAWTTFGLQTATRMNATFPYVAPAVSLPTDPPRHVVDAGYFDNYGITTALTYLGRPEIRRWLKDKELSGALIIQINAFPVLFDVKRDDDKRRMQCQEDPPYAGLHLVDWLTSPLEALAAARESSMVFRNEQALTQLRELYEKEDLHLTRIALENTSRASLSWYLPEAHLMCMQLELGDSNPRNAEAFKRILDLWQTRSAYNKDNSKRWDWPTLRE